MFFSQKNRVRPSATSRHTRLLFFVTEDWYFVSHRLPLAVAAKAAGYDVAVITRVRAHGDRIRLAGLRLIPLENSRGGMDPFTELRTLFKLIAIYRREQPDIVHHVAIKPVLYGSIAARFAGNPCTINALAGMGWLFSSGAGRARWLTPMVRFGLGRLLQRGNALVQNPDDGRLLTQLGVPQSRVRRIAGSGVDLGKFSPEEERKGMPIVVLPARLLWNKGVGEFVTAARLLQQKHVNARFVLAGTPDQANPSAVPLSQLLQWQEEGVIEYLGWVHDMPRVLAESHIVCLPSFYGEGIPKCLIEAAASGRPIVTTDMPGCREIVHHGDNGYLVPVRNAAALAEALSHLIENPSLRQQMGRRGRIRAEQEFGLEIVIQQTLALYQERRSS
jgi:glycosyltransferase involved in cell wall biosynthesis